jgi:Uma2 family endonuclease
MATVTTPPDLKAEAEGDQCVVLPGIGWKGYATLLKLRGERPYPRLIYLDGSVTLVSPSYEHDQIAEALGLFVFFLADGLEIPCKAAGSTTFRRRPKKGGAEADKSFYFANRHRIRGKNRLSLRTDPPPDLAIEVVVSHDAEEAVEVWRRFGVPEVWVCDQHRLTILRLGADGQYAESDRSLAFPTLRAAEIHPWVTRDQDESDQAWARELRRWVADVLVPRQRELAAKSSAQADQPGNQGT